MVSLRRIGAVGGLLLASALAPSLGCGDNSDGPEDTAPADGKIRISISGSPQDVSAIHIAVTAPDYLGSVDADL